MTFLKTTAVVTDGILATRLVSDFLPETHLRKLTLGQVQNLLIPPYSGASMLFPFITRKKVSCVSSLSSVILRPLFSAFVFVELLCNRQVWSCVERTLEDCENQGDFALTNRYRFTQLRKISI